MWSSRCSVMPVYTNSVSLQPSLLRPAGPDGGWTSCLSALLWGGSIQQLGTAPPHLVQSWANPAPAGPGVSQQPSGLSSRQQSAAPAVQPEPRQPTATLRGGAVVTFQGQDSWRGHPGTPPPTDRRQRHSIDTDCLSMEARLWSAANWGGIWTVQKPCWF